MEPRCLFDTNTIRRTTDLRVPRQRNRVTREVWRSLQRRSSSSNKSHLSW